MVKYSQDIVAGETFKVECHDCGYVSTSLAVRGPSLANITGVAVNNRWTFAADSTAWLAGDYQFELWVNFPDGDKKCLARNTFTVATSLTTLAAGADIRSVSQQNVDVLEAYLAGIGNPDMDQSVLRYRINNRELFSYPIGEIQDLLSMYRQRVASERRKARGLPGPGPNINVYI